MRSSLGKRYLQTKSETSVYPSVKGLSVSLGFLIDLNARTVFEGVATAGDNVRTIFGGENHFRLKCALTEKRGMCMRPLYTGECYPSRTSNISL